MQIHEIGRRYYWHAAQYADRFEPLCAVESTQEIEEPYRVGVARVFRVPFSRRVLVIGRWMYTLDEDDALLGAIGGEWLDYLPDPQVTGHVAP